MAAIEGVIARYEEDVSWAQNIPFPIIIYNKGKFDTGLEKTHAVIRRSNLGRESETYLHHLIERYDSLPEHLVLLQGNPFDHCRGINTIFADLPCYDFAQPLAGNTKHEDLLLEYNWPGFKECLTELAAFLGVKSSSLIYGTGAQYVVPREKILARPRETYEKLLLRVSKNVNPLEGWAMERLWGYLFGYENKSNSLMLNTLSLEDFDGIMAAQDLVCMVTNRDTFDPARAPKAAEAFYKKKYSVPTEEDPCVFFEGAFLTHANVLRLYAREGKSLSPQFFADRLVPVLTLEG